MGLRFRLPMKKTELPISCLPNNLPAAAPAIGSINAYIYWANQIPMLSAEEEWLLANNFIEHNDLSAARSLILSHLRFVIRIASGYLGYGLPNSDLIQEGTIGLMKAVKKFNPKLGVRLAAFAVHWIKAEIHEFVLRNWRIVKIATTKAQRKLFFNLRRIPKKLTWFTQDEVETIARELSVEPAEVRQMEARMHNQDVSFDGHQDEDSEESGPLLPVDYLVSANGDPQEVCAVAELADRNIEGLHQMLATLDDRSRDIMEARWLREQKTTLQELATKYHLSVERVRQIEEAAIGKLRQGLSS